MLFLLSPAKSLNFDVVVGDVGATAPSFMHDSKELVLLLKKFSAKDLMKLMKISDKLAMLNYQRFQDFSLPFNTKNSKPALFVFDGDVYEGIDVKNYKKDDLDFANQHLRILSGLYGILRPLDLMQPYRLEMGTALKNLRGKNLYEFWSEKITDYLNEELKKTEQKTAKKLNKKIKEKTKEGVEQTILNLASEEYFKVVDTSKINGRIVNIIFKEKKGKDYKIIGLFAKKARGLMADFIIKHKIQNPEEVKKFSVNGYSFSKKFSDENNWCFCRE